MEHQDWNPTILRKNNTQFKKKGTSVLKTSGRKNAQRGQHANSKMDDNEYCPEKKVSHELKMQIQKARTGKKLTQKQLANQCNLTIKTIQDYENGKALPNPQILNKLNRVLGVKLARK